MPLILHFIFSFIATIGFAVLFNVPKNSLWYGGLAGGFGWTIYTYMMQQNFSGPMSNFTASIIVAMFGEIFARIDKKPVTLFVIPGIIPLVPGFGMYNSIIHLLNDQFQQGMIISIETLFNAGAIALGIIVVSSIAKTLKVKPPIKDSSL